MLPEHVIWVDPAELEPKNGHYYQALEDCYWYVNPEGQVAFHSYSGKLYGARPLANPQLQIAERFLSGMPEGTEIKLFSLLFAPADHHIG